MHNPAPVFVARRRIAGHCGFLRIFAAFSKGTYFCYFAE
jgi:hypothetical protein